MGLFTLSGAAPRRRAGRRGRMSEVEWTVVHLETRTGERIRRGGEARNNMGVKGERGQRRRGHCLRQVQEKESRRAVARHGLCGR